MTSSAPVTEIDESVASPSVAPPRIAGDVMLGIGDPAPRLRWVVSEAVGTQTARRIEVRRADGRIEVDDARDDRTVDVRWPFAPLTSRERVDVRVSVADATGTWSAPSEWQSIEAGLLTPSDWTAQWVMPTGVGGLDDPAPVLIRDIELPSAPVRARLYVTARGLYEFAIDGEKVGDAYLTPGWTAYERRVRYQTYDVTDMLRAGSIRLTALLGNGWYRGQLVWPGNRSSYGDRLALLAQLEVQYADGSTRTFGTDRHWVSASSRIVSDDLYDGESQDLTADADAQETFPVDSAPLDEVALEAPTGPAVRIVDTKRPIGMRRTTRDSVIVDFGQNLVGFVRLRVRGRRGAVVVVRHAEVLEHGEPAYRPLRSAKATASYILSGGDDVLAPRLSFYGFRYAEISGVADLRETDLEAVVISSDMRRIGWFDSSDARLNRLHQNVVWSMRGNFVDLPTDCPQRDERLGWTGDIQVFAPTAAFLFDTDGFLSGWLRDLTVQQRPDGAVPSIIPDVIRSGETGEAGWGDAAVVVPMSLWRAYGDLGVLRTQYPSMRAWVEYVRSRSEDDLWTTGFQFGDWLDPIAPAEDPGGGRADRYVVASAYYARSTRLLAEAAAALGYDSDAREYAALHRRIVAAFDRAFVSSEGRIRSDAQTVYALAIVEDLIVDDAARVLAGERLAELVIAEDCRVATGFLGTPVILEALTLAGRADLAARMLRQSEAPSWLYAVDMGATTIWERWDSLLPDGRVHPGSMTSFNHYAYGAVAEWMHQRLAGLSPLEPGYRRVAIAPMTTAGLDYVSIEHTTPYGALTVAWRSGDRFELDTTIPVGVIAEVTLPGATRTVEVGSGTHRLGVVDAETVTLSEAPWPAGPAAR